MIRLKSLLSEAVTGFEPAIGQESKFLAYKFDEGQPNRTSANPLTTTEVDSMLSHPAAIDMINMIASDVLPTLEKFSNPDEGGRRFTKIPSFIDIYASTSSSGDDDANYQVGMNRLNAARQLVVAMFNRAAKQRGTYSKRLDQATLLSLITNKGDSLQYPSRLNQIYVGSKSEPDPGEQYIAINIRSLTRIGSQYNWIQTHFNKIMAAKGEVFNDEDAIATEFEELAKNGGYSDLIDLNAMFQNAGEGGIQDFVNYYIEGTGEMFGDKKERERIVGALNRMAARSGEGKPVSIVDDKISINPNIPDKE